MKRNLATLLLGLLLLSSCATNRKYITNYSDCMEIVRSYFPEIYELYRRGEVIIDSVYEQCDKEEKLHYHISYHYRPSSH